MGRLLSSPAGLGAITVLLAALSLLPGGCTVPLPPGETAPPGPEEVPPPPVTPDRPGGPDHSGGPDHGVVAPADGRPRDASRSPPAAARTEVGSAIPEIVITGHALSGYWAVTASSSIDLDVGLLSGVRIRYSGDARDRDICRIDHQGERLRATCIAGFAPTARGSAVDGTVTLRWWTGPATVIFRGAWDDLGAPFLLPGRLTGGIAGLGLTGDIPATMRKIAPPDSGDDARDDAGDDTGGGLPEPPGAARMRSVLEDLRQGRMRPDLYEGIAAKRLEPAFSWVGAKEPRHRLRYLGRIHIRWHRWQRETLQDVYEVTSPTDRSLCRIATGDSGRVVDFACQSLGETRPARDGR
ncbi:MAG: hypothetical protein F8N37_18520 [Telmatospirillum sp.]|nr:hypothetical protein [Telmatospirillum sp.]